MLEMFIKAWQRMTEGWFVVVVRRRWVVLVWDVSFLYLGEYKSAF